MTLAERSEGKLEPIVLIKNKSSVGRGISVPLSLSLSTPWQTTKHGQQAIKLSNGLLLTLEFASGERNAIERGLRHVSDALQG